MRLVALGLALMVSGCVSAFPVRTCQDAKRAVGHECGHQDISDWTCWDDISLRGTSAVLSEELFACLDGATTCFEVDSCLENHGFLTAPGIVPDSPGGSPPPYEEEPTP